MNSEALATEATPEVVEINKSILDGLIQETTQKSAQLQQYAIVPKGFEESERLAKYLHKSQWCPRTKDGPWSEADIFAAIQAGLELGISPMQALSGTAVINGKPGIYGDLALAVVLRSGMVEDWYERPIKEALEKGEGYFKIKRKGRPTPTEVYFTISDAKTANLWGKQGPWTQYPGRMLQMRARAFALRDCFPDALKGMSIIEEVRDYPLTQEVIRETMAEPKRKSETPPAAAETTTQDRKAAPAASPSPTDEKSGTWTGVLASVDRKDGTTKDAKTGKDKPYTLYTLIGRDGQKFASFSDTQADLARSCVSTECEVRIKWEAGKYGPKVQAVEPIQPDEPGANG